MIMIDHFTSMISTAIIPSEQTDNLKTGIINLTTSIRHPGPITVVTDWAPGFISAAKNDKQLQDLHISLILKDKLNVKFNAVVDRACQDLESELRKLAPEGNKINSANLAKATIATNALYCRKQGISAYEIHTSHSQDTGANINLDNKQLHNKQIKSHKPAPDPVPAPDIKVGDSVTQISSQDKHKSRDIYLVTQAQPDKVSAQHPLTDTPLKFMSQPYTAHPKHLHRIYRPPHSHREDSPSLDSQPTKPSTQH